MGCRWGDFAMSAVSRTVKKGTKPVSRANAMTMFVWEGTDKRGIKMKGDELARNANMLRAELRRRGIIPTVVKTKPKPLFGAAGKPIKAKEIAFFSRQMATMMKSGVPIVGSLEIIGEGAKNPRMRKWLAKSAPTLREAYPQRGCQQASSTV